jgi:outer membrane protein TolC
MHSGAVRVKIKVSLLIGVTTAALVAIRPSAAQEPRRVTLDEALTLFGQNNLDLELARAEAAAVAGEAWQAAAYPNPTAAAAHEPLSDGDRSLSESTLSLSQRLVWPGTRSAERDGARRVADAASFRLAADSARLAFEVKRAFVDAARAERAEQALIRVTGVFRDGDRSAEERYGADDISLYDRRRIHVERIRYETRLAESALEAAAARRRLALLVAPAADALELAPADEPVGSPPDVGIDEAVSAALVRRPDVTAAEASLAAARARASAARRARIPDLTATGGYKSQSDGLAGAVLGVSIALPIWDRRGGAIQSAEARVAAADSRFGLTLRQVENDIRRAVDAYRSTARRAAFLEEPVEDGPDLLDIARASYGEGEMELIELLDAAEAHLDAHLARARLRADLWINYYDLERAVGGFDDPTNEGEDG